MVEHKHRHHDESMLNVDEALERILSFFNVLSYETKSILDALGQVLAQNVIGAFDIPSADNSAMDGYAVQAASVEGATNKSPKVLKVVGTVAAGQIPANVVIPGTAVRIMTGGWIPEGSNAVVPFEDTDEVDSPSSSNNRSKISIYSEVEQGENIRPAGQDISKGDLIIAAGTELRPPHIGILASLGYDEVTVVRRPVVAILATGDELLSPSDDHKAGKVYDSNSYGLAAAVQHSGGTPIILGIAGDDLDAIEEKLRGGLGSDMLITSAGVSKGDYDIVKDVLSKHGKIHFWSIRMRPAKPLAFGVINGPDGQVLPHLGLPGNPVSALVAFEQFGRPAMHKMLGKGQLTQPTIEAVLEEPIYNTDGRRVYARAVVTKRGDTYYAKLTGHQSSNLLTSMSRANGLAICPEARSKIETGEIVTVQMLDWSDNVF